MINFEPKDLSVPEVHRYLIGGIGPRPIALVSTLSESGIPNLTPFSFFNVFGANPPIIAFSPSRRGKTASLKDSYNNLIATNECVVQVVTYSIVEQINIASAEYPPEVNEFIKSGLTPLKSDLVKPFRVKESPYQMECVLREMKSFGDKGSAANIAICEVIKFHISEVVIEDGIIRPNLIDLVGRMGADYYCRARDGGIFEMVQPRTKLCVGYDNLPTFVKESQILSANNMGKLASVEQIPNQEEAVKFIDEFQSKQKENIEITEKAFYDDQKLNKYKEMFYIALNLKENNTEKKKELLELSIKTALENNDIQIAWYMVLYILQLNLITD